MGRLSNEERQRRANAANAQPQSATPEPVRDEVKRMSGFSSEDDMKASLRSDTNQPTGDEKPKRARRTKAEMEATRTATVADPNMADPRYKEAIAKMNAFGGPKLISGTFAAVGVAMGDRAIPLNTEEKADVDDYFYVLSKKYNVLDPTRHWITMAVYFFGMLGSFILTRVLGSKGNSLSKQIASWFGGEETKEETPEPNSQE
jgi:hypothetical protein